MSVVVVEQYGECVVSSRRPESRVLKFEQFLDEVQKAQRFIA